MGKKAGPAAPVPYYEDELVTIFHGRAEDVLPSLEPGSVDLVLSDPPYGIGYQSKAKDLEETKVAGDESLNAVRDVIHLLDRVLADDCHAYLFAAASKVGELADIVEWCWTVKNVLVWDKGPMGTRGDCVAGFAINWEAIVYAMKGRRPLRGKRPRAILRYDWTGRRDPVHPTVKPVGLLMDLVAKSTGEGELVLDPFMGSGPTLRAARDLGRRAVGIELDERYCEIAARRLTEVPFDGMLAEVLEQEAG